jgi:hypothetical protein
VVCFLIQLNLGSSAYNFNFRKYVLINYESCIGAFLLTALLPYLSYYYPLHIILILHLLSTNYKRTQPCYFPLLYKPAAQKVKMVLKNSSTRSSRLCTAPIAVSVALWRLPLFCFTRESLSL